jgi:hypothetical protein
MLAQALAAVGIGQTIDHLTQRREQALFLFLAG